MKISLIIPAYNEEKYIGACLESVIENGAGLFEIIVVNNASTDKTEAIAQTFPGVRVVRELSKGLTKARQRGLMEARGDVVAFIDADTKIPKRWVEKMAQAFEKNPETVCISGPYIYYDSSFFAEITLWLFWRFLLWPTRLLTGYFVLGGNFAARKNALESIGGFDKNISFYGEDTDIARRLHQVGKIKFIMRLVILTSARRFKGEGLIITSIRYGLNFFSEVLIKKPVTNEYKDIRQ
jgi:glycosyltransferase involved in cell wall biosynthesis